MNRLEFLPSVERVPWDGQETAGDSGDLGSVQWVRDALRNGLLALLFGLLMAGLSLPASAETLFTTQTPVVMNQNDGVSYELGMKFQSTVDGQITAIRYWKAANEPTGNHVGHIWDSSKNLLATTTFTNETASGWQQQALATPLSIKAGTTYVVSVNIASYYVDTVSGLAVSVVNGDLSSVADGQNGVFGTSGAFPTQSFSSGNYFRDVVFTPTSTTPQACTNNPGKQLVLQKLVSVDGGTTFNPYPTLANPALAQSGIPVQFKLVVTNCSTGPLTPVTVDDCINFDPNANPFACANNGPGIILYEPPVSWPAVSGVTYPLQPNSTVTFTTSELPNLTVPNPPNQPKDICSNVPADSTVRNDAEADAKDSAGNAVSFDAFAYVKCPPASPAKIKLLKQISVDNGVTWLDADTAATAPTVVAPSGALYRFIVSNIGNVTLTNLSVSDPTLGFTNVLIPGSTLTAGQSVNITSGTSGFTSLSQPGRCTSTTIGTLTNTATVTGTPTNGGPNVTDSNPAVLICQPPPGKTVSIGPSSMEGAIKIANGDWVNGGYSLKSIVTGDLTVVAKVTITGPCSNGGTDTVTVPLQTMTYTNPNSAKDWLPTGDANSVLSWQGSVRVGVNSPTICGGVGKLDASKGAVFMSTVSSNPSQPGSTVTFRFKYRDPAAKGKPNTNCLDTTDPNRNKADVCGASWSETKTFDP